MTPFNWRGRDRLTGKVRTFYTESATPDVASLRDHLEHHYRGLEVVDIEPANGPPKAVLKPVPPQLFQAGILDLVRRELRGNRGRAVVDLAAAVRAGLPQTPIAIGPAAARPIPCGPLSATLKPLR